MKSCSDSAQQPAHDREDCKPNANTDDSNGWSNFCHADTWAQLMREPSVSPVPEDNDSDWLADSSAEQLAIPSHLKLSSIRDVQRWLAKSAEATERQPAEALVAQPAEATRAVAAEVGAA